MSVAPCGLLCAGLAMNWREFLTLAARLAAGAAEEDWRSAVSRAYYSAFHVARQLLSDLGFTVVYIWESDFNAWQKQVVRSLWSFCHVFSA